MPKESLRLWRDLGNLLEIAANFGEIAAVLALDGRVRTGAQLLSRSEALHEEIGAAPAWWVTTRNERPSPPFVPNSTRAPSRRHGSKAKR